jgi:hypothetical protein
MNPWVRCHEAMCLSLAVTVSHFGNSPNSAQERFRLTGTVHTELQHSDNTVQRCQYAVVGSYDGVAARRKIRKIKLTDPTNIQGVHKVSLQF